MRTGRLLTYVFCLFIAASAQATEISGPLSGILTLSGSPYLVTADIDVLAGDSLHVEAGCELSFEAGVSFHVHGHLWVMGEAEGEVAFLAAESSSWSGINLFGEGWREFHHFVLSGAETGIHVFAGEAIIEDGDIGPTLNNGLRIESDFVTARRLEIHESQTPGYTGLFVFTASPEILDVEVWGCAGAAGIGLWGPAAPTLTGCEVRSCLSGITCVAASPIIDDAWIHDNGFAGNFDSGAGLYVGYPGGEPVLTASRIEGNCFGVSVVLDGSVNLGDVDNGSPDDDGLNHFVANDLYDGLNRHVWNGTPTELMAQNNYWAGSDGTESDDPSIIDGWIIDDEEGEGGAVNFIPLAGATAAGDAPAQASAWAIHPNPANPTFTLKGNLPAAGRLCIDLISPSGRRASRLLSEHAEIGSFTRTFRTAGLASGFYLVRVELNGSVQAVGRLALIR